VTPLILIAGFLGAGKTTLLRRLLPELGSRGLRPRVFLNDYENARVDAAALRDVTTALVPISGSCLCCATQDELVAALGDVDGDDVDAVVVETNGTTDTGHLIELLTAAPGLAGLGLPLQATVVDAQRFGKRGWQNVLEADQIATSTHLLFGRTDLVDPARAAEVRVAARALAPRAAECEAASLAAQIANLRAALRAQPARHPLDAPRTHEGHARSHFASFQLPLPGRYDPGEFQRFLEELPTEVLRAKGIVTLTDPPGAKRVFQKVDRAIEISPCELMDPDEIEPVAVFVGVGAETLVIRARLARLVR